jgi:hypothetical protein
VSGSGILQAEENVVDNDEKLLAEYERAQEVALHTDSIVHEVTSIAWAANTLLLGFILEVDCKSSNQILVIAASIVGIVVTLYVPCSIERIKQIQHIAYNVCRKIEIDNNLLPHQLHTKIDEEYPKSKPGQRAVMVLTIVFILAWISVIAHAGICLCYYR